MAQFIIEMGSGNTCRNDVGLVREMIDAVASVDSGRHTVMMKWQLFDSAPPNEPLLWRVFAYGYGYAYERGYMSTASVFDSSALVFLRHFDVPFIKIANQVALHGLAVGGGTFYMSYAAAGKEPACQLPMACVSEYPASVQTYEDRFTTAELKRAVSDHTVGWELYHRYQPLVIEKHFVLEHSDTNPDGGPFAVTPAELAEVL